MGNNSGGSVSRVDFLRMTADIVSSYLGGNVVEADDVAEVIKDVYGTIEQIGCVAAEPAPQQPAVAVRRSVTPEYLVCLEDGRKLKMLKRHLKTAFGMTPQEYRARWGLPSDYPMVAPNYAKSRSEFAKKIGLGRRSPT